MPGSLQLYKDIASLVFRYGTRRAHAALKLNSAAYSTGIYTLSKSLKLLLQNGALARTYQKEGATLLLKHET